MNLLRFRLAGAACTIGIFIHFSRIGSEQYGDKVDLGADAD